MSTWRSETMKRGTLMLPVGSAEEYIHRIALDCCIQFIDMNATTGDRPYRRTVTKIANIQKHLTELKRLVVKFTGDEIPALAAEDDFACVRALEFDVDQIESEVMAALCQVKELDVGRKKVEQCTIRAVEYQSVLRLARTLHKRRATGHQYISDDTKGEPTNKDSEQDNGDPKSLLITLCGVIELRHEQSLLLSVRQLTRGKIHAEFVPISFAIDGYGEFASRLGVTPRSAFLLIFQGSEQSYLASKLTTLLRSYEATMYTTQPDVQDALRGYIDPEQDEGDDPMRTLEANILLQMTALDKVESHLHDKGKEMMKSLVPNGGAKLQEWDLVLQLHKAKYAALNCFVMGSERLRCDIWYPEYDEDNIKTSIAFTAHGCPPAFLVADPMHPNDPPTHFRNTGFTRGFQNFVDTYGYPRYRELNPALITSVTLPYFYGIMYGDVGHGIFTLLGGLLLISLYKKLKGNQDEMVQMVLGGRYMITLMGIFAIYCGIIYNDFMSLGMDIFGTRYGYDHLIQGGTKAVWAPRADLHSFPYPFGFDPVWKGADNELTFLNSFKMKFAIITAGLHMGLGVMFKGVNAVINRDRISLLCEFVPQILFFCLFVGYIDFLIIYKWANPDTAPGLISTIIEFAMFKEPEQPLYDGQAIAQKVMFCVMMICLPWMLIPKPFLEKRKHDRACKATISQEATGLHLAKAEEGRAFPPMSDASCSHSSNSSDSEEDRIDIEFRIEKFDFGEEATHQLIETIEFGLGAVSNTASYLRLWALSLAHQELSVVFFEMILLKGLELDASMSVRLTCSIIAFFFFSIATTLVMLCMDALECYLHALRLHWVEFQGKFFKADGVPFERFEYKLVTEGVTVAVDQ